MEDIKQLVYLPNKSFQNIDTEIVGETIKALVKLEDEFILRIMREFLDKEPSKDDYRKFSIVKKIGQHNVYQIAFYNVPIGMVERVVGVKDVSMKFTKFF